MSRIRPLERLPFHRRRLFAAAAGAALVAAAPRSPAQDMPLSQVLVDGTTWTLSFNGARVIASVAADAAGHVYFADPLEGVIHRQVEGDSFEPFAKEPVVDLAFGPNGRLFAASLARREIITFDPSGRRTILASAVAAEHLLILPDGSFYAAETGRRRILRFPAAGGTPLVASTQVDRPAGMVLADAGGTLVVADTSSRALWSFSIQRDGTLTAGDRNHPLRLRPGQLAAGAAGLVADRDGRIYAAAAEGVHVFDPTARLSGVLTPAGAPTDAGPVPALDLAFAGPERTDLYLAAGGQLHRRPMKVPGLAPPA